MSELTIIWGALENQTMDGHLARIPLLADRATLAKRRWRSVAVNGREFGFDLERSLAHGDLFHIENNEIYVIEQVPENVLEVAIVHAASAARVAWYLGNLHLLIEILPHAVRVSNDPAARRALEAAGVPFEQRR